MKNFKVRLLSTGKEKLEGLEDYERTFDDYEKANEYLKEITNQLFYTLKEIWENTDLRYEPHFNNYGIYAPISEKEEYFVETFIQEYEEEIGSIIEMED